MRDLTSAIGFEVKGLPVPLSEEEQRLLAEIERQFYESDPDLARTVGKTTVYTHAGRNLKWAAFGFVASLVVLVASFTSSLFLGFAGFIGMLACAVVFQQNLRRMGRASLNSVRMARGGSFKHFLEQQKSRNRDRFKRDR